MNPSIRVTLGGMKGDLDRREFLGLLGGAAASLAFGGCGSDDDPGRYTPEDVALLAEQRVREAAQAGRGRFGPLRFRGYRGLAELPWFELDPKGILRCVDESFPRAIDFHCHLGMSVLFEPKLDLLASTDRVRHLLDCDAEQPGCELDLDVYINGNFSEPALRTLERHTVSQGLWGSDFARTQTIPNLLAEMDATRIEAAEILPIALGLPFGDALTEHWIEAIDAANARDRLWAGFSVHPRDPDRLEQMEAFAARGLRVMKLHPTVQRFYPDDPDLMPLYERAQALGLVVFFHGGRAGIEPESSHRYAMPRHYEAPIADFPKLPFVLGHAGARDGEAMLAMGARYENAWFGTHGQGVSRLDEMIRKTGAERMLFGTDWPFYHLAASLAKILIVTRDSGREAARHAILRDNASRLLEPVA